MTDNELLGVADERGSPKTLQDLMGMFDYKGTNFEASPSTFVPQGTTFQYFPTPYNMTGAVSPRKDPNKVYVLSNEDPDVVPHEGGHVAALRNPTWDKRLRDADTTMRDEFMPSPILDLKLKLRSSNNPDLRSAINANTFNDRDELFRTLEQINGMQPAGKKLKDHPLLGPLITPKMEKLTDIYMNPDVNKITGPEDFVSTDTRKPLSYIEQFRRWVRNKTK